MRQCWMSSFKDFCGCTVLDMTAMGNDQAIRLPGKAAITVVTFILLDLKFYGA